MQVLRRAPQVLGYKTTTLYEKVDVLAEYMGEDAARQLVISYASVCPLLLFVLLALGWTLCVAEPGTQCGRFQLIYKLRTSL